MARKTNRHRSLAEIDAAVRRCRRCPRLREYCAEVARVKRRSYADWDYWGKPVPGFGDPRAKIMIIGLAPAAHGANRTGRVFTGDRSGDFLFAALHRVGLANQPESISIDDGLKLSGAYVTASARCAPPGNKPSREELVACQSYMDEEAVALKRWRVLIALGGIGWASSLGLLERRGVEIPRPRPKFGHAARFEFDGGVLLGCYHVSQQNTFTGRLTPAMIDDVLELAIELAG
jgi:uracil-DNA glycosylase family 4